MSEEMNNALSPTLQTKDVQKLVDFYTDLGYHFDMGVNAPDGKMAMAMLRTPCQRGMIMIEYSENFVRPQGDSQYVYANLPKDVDIDEAFGGFKAKGVKITMEIETMWYGDRVFSFEDPDGHKWSVAKTIKEFNPADAPAGWTMKMPAGANA